MEQKIFLLIAIFCIALVKSSDEDDYETEPEIPEYIGNPGVGYPGGFPKDVLLCEAISLWGGDESKRECFQKQYKNGSDLLADAIRDFSQEILKAFSETSQKVRENLVTQPKAELEVQAEAEMEMEAEEEPDFETVAQEIQTSEQALGDLLKQYPQQLSELVEKGNYDGMKKLMEDFKSKIEDSEGKYNKNFLKLKGIMYKSEDLKTTAREYENKRNTELDDLVDAGKQVMELLKKCLTEKES